MGIVYLAREVHLDRLVAIKVLPPERAAEETLRERFLREARLAAKLSHPNIIPIHSVEETGDFVFFVMAFIDGETLAQRVRGRGPLTPSEGIRVLREVSWALAYAHAQGLIHRDVKPDNILLESSSGRVMVADFGIAAAAGDADDAGVSGTPEFMSPEQALAKPIDARSDLYGLGATAFFAFSGKLPFEGKTATEILAKHVTEQPPTLTSLGLTVPRKVALLVDRCLSKEPEHRPASSQAIAEQLANAAEQRRELPAALRMFVKRTSRLNGGGTVVAGIALLPLSVYMSYLFGNVGGFGTLILGLTAAPFAYFVWAARKVSLQGFAHRDIEPGFKAEIEQAREELMVGQKQRGPSPFERWLKLGFKIAGVTALVAGAAWLTMGLTPIPRSAMGFWRLIGTTAAVAGNIAVYSGIGLLGLMQRHRDLDSEFWSRLWMGRIGKSAFSFARKLLGSRVKQVAMTHRATELSLGLAAEQLYDGLPAETRAQLGDLPDVLQRLQDDAQALRRHYEGLQEALADAGDAATSLQYAEVRATRDAIHAKLGETVGALETIRLNLLRLHAGSATVEGLTTHLSIASEVSEEVARLIAAYEDMGHQLQFPRQPAVTPV